MQDSYLDQLPVLWELYNFIERESLSCKQCWLADDSSAAGTIDDLKIWFDKLVDVGLKYGYHVNVEKPWVILKSDSNHEKAQQAFQGTQYSCKVFIK